MTAWWIEVFGGPAATPRARRVRGDAAQHQRLGITAEQRFRFASLMSLAADDAGLPDDPEFRAAFVAYVEWGTRLALELATRAPKSSSRRPCRAGAGVAPPYQP